MRTADRHELVRRDLASRGVDLDQLVRDARAQGSGWRVVTALVNEQVGYDVPIAHSTVRRWYEDEPVEAAS